MINNPFIAMVATFAIALIWLRAVDYIAHKGLISGPLSRKIIHSGTGPIFVLCWLLFPDNAAISRYLAALVPFMITVQFALVGTGIMKDQASVDAMSRTGDRKEILRGPLYYGIVFVVLTLVFWKESPLGIIGLMLMCGGDGLADIIGSRFDSPKIPWSPKKTLLGSATMFAGGWVFTVLVLLAFEAAGVYPVGSMMSWLLNLTIIAGACTLLESLPFKDIDNITVPALAVLLGMVMFV
jgi:phytol kinase